MHPVFGKTMQVSIKPQDESKQKPADEIHLHKDDEENSWEWYDPPEESPAVNFLRDTTLHGLQYLGQRQRHICERIFWLTAFTAAVITATMLIRDLWSAYLNMPIITVFNPTEKAINEIPFPAVTICNVNNIQKSKMRVLKSQAKEGLAKAVPDADFLHTLASLVDIYHICQAGKTFMGRFVDSLIDENFFDELEDEINNRRKEYINLSNPTETLLQYSQPCHEMIKFCVWLDKIRNCSDLFQEIETDYGYCCTFNIMPVSLLKRNITDPRDDPQRLQDWMDANLDSDNLLFTAETKNRTYPERQKYPGRGSGLSILLNPDLDEYYCTNTDSEGFVVALNVPLDFPRMRDNGIAVPTNSEVFISARPEITMPDESIKQFSLQERDCYFSHEKPLPHYTKYTTSNCMDECIAKRTLRTCECIRYYMPNNRAENENETLCKPDKYNCTEEVRENITQRGIGGVCKKCLPTCTEISYTTETTSLPIRKAHVRKLLNQFPELCVINESLHVTRSSKAHNVSILHIYINVDSIYPRLRRQMTSMISLISNAGGLLGLCMGFSMLSLLEIIYHATIRLFWKSYRERLKERKNEEGKKSCSDHLGDYETNTIKLTNEASIRKKNGFLAKVFQWGPIHIGSSVVNQELTRPSTEDKLPPYFHTPFGSDFYGAYLKKAWQLPDAMEKTSESNNDN